jgi:hypothetical protein
MEGSCKCKLQKSDKGRYYRFEDGVQFVVVVSGCKINMVEKQTVSKFMYYVTAVSPEWSLAENEVLNKKLF